MKFYRKHNVVGEDEFSLFILARFTFLLDRKIFFLDIVQTLVSLSYSASEFQCESSRSRSLCENVHNYFLSLLASRVSLSIHILFVSTKLNKNFE